MAQTRPPILTDRPAAEPLPLVSPGHYGADAAGMVCGFLFAPGQPGEPVDAAAAEAWLAALPAPDGDGRGDTTAWLHFNLAHTATLPWLRAHARLPEPFFESLHENPHSTRIERVDDALLAVVSDVRHDFAYEASDISTLWVSVHPRLVVTARRQSLRSVDRLRAAVKAGEPMHSSVDLLAHLLRNQADVLVGIVRHVASAVDEVEDDLLAGRLARKRVRLGAMRRLLVRLQRLLAPEPAALFRLLQHPPRWTGEPGVQELRAASEEFSVALRDMATLQERIKLLQEEIAAQVNEGNNESLFVLTVVTVLALPINMVAGLLGMNVGGVPLADAPHGFWVVVAIVLVITALAGWVAWRGRDDR